jgi:glutamyl-Q tRNA(Asp) synthetase
MALRIEDIDQTRCRPEFEASLFEDLEWLGVSWVGPVVRQSERFLDYHVALQGLEGEGLLYPCFCTRAEVRQSLGAPHGHDGPLYPGTCRRLSQLERTERRIMGSAYSLRLDVAEAVRRFPSLSFTDERRGGYEGWPVSI